MKDDSKRMLEWDTEMDALNTQRTSLTKQLREMEPDGLTRSERVAGTLPSYHPSCQLVITPRTCAPTAGGR